MWEMKTPSVVLPEDKEQGKESKRAEIFFETIRMIKEMRKGNAYQPPEVKSLDEEKQEWY